MNAKVLQIYTLICICLSRHKLLDRPFVVGIDTPAKVA